MQTKRKFNWPWILKQQLKTQKMVIYKMKKITIHWGTDKDPQDKKSYEFKTDEQLKYFMMGVDEANGWLEYEIEEEE